MSKERRTPTLADPDGATAHFRAVIDRDHLATATALVVICDDQGEPTQQWHVVGCAIDATPSDCTAVLNELLSRAEDWTPTTGLALAVTRPGGEELQPYDRTWFRAYYRICHQRNLRPYGVYCVTRTGARPLHIDDAA